MDVLDAVGIAAILLAILVVLIVLTIACAIGFLIASAITVCLIIGVPMRAVRRALWGRR